MSQIVALLKPIPAHGVDETEYEFSLIDWQVDLLDQMIARGYARDRGGVVHRLINESLIKLVPNGYQNIGRCETCGLVDHHLVDAMCPACCLRYAEAAELDDRIGDIG